MVVVLRRCLSCLCVSSRRRSSSSNSRRRSCLCLSSHSLCCRRCRRRPCWCVMFHAPPPPPPPPPPPWPVTKLLQTHFLPNTLAQHCPRRAYRCLSRSRAHPPPLPVSWHLTSPVAKVIPQVFLVTDFLWVTPWVYIHTAHAFTHRPHSSVGPQVEKGTCAYCLGRNDTTLFPYKIPKHTQCRDVCTTTTLNLPNLPTILLPAHPNPARHLARLPTPPCPQSCPPSDPHLALLQTPPDPSNVPRCPTLPVTLPTTLPSILPIHPAHPNPPNRPLFEFFSTRTLHFSPERRKFY